MWDHRSEDPKRDCYMSAEHELREYEIQAGSRLKSAIWEKGLTLRSFASMLTTKGCPCSVEALSAKLYRGTFSAAFYLLCLKILADCHREH